MTKNIFLALALCFISFAANAALLKLDANFHDRSPSACNSYIYECPNAVQLTMVFDTGAYDSSSMTFDMGRLNGWRFEGLVISSLILRTDDRILLDGPADLTFRSSGFKNGGGINSSCVCDLALSGDGIQLHINYDIHGGTWPIAAEIGSDPLALVLGGIGKSGSSVFNSFYGDWGSLGSYSGSVNFSVVPLPAAAWLFGGALGLLGLARRRSAA
jgi:hypothetical protein